MNVDVQGNNYYCLVRRVLSIYSMRLCMCTKDFTRVCQHYTVLLCP